MKNCIFCELANGNGKRWTVYEDAKFIVILPLEAHAEGHLLIIPKEHYRWVWDYPNMKEYFELTRKMARLLQKTYKTDFIMGVQHGDGVPHAHNHLIPRFPNDGHGEVLNEKLIFRFSEKEKDKILAKIKKNLK